MGGGLAAKAAKNTKQSLVAPLPPGWTQHWDEEGTPYYYEEATGASSWESPMDDVRRAGVWMQYAALLYCFHNKSHTKPLLRKVREVCASVLLLYVQIDRRKS